MVHDEFYVLECIFIQHFNIKIWIRCNKIKTNSFIFRTNLPNLRSNLTKNSIKAMFRSEINVFLTLSLFACVPLVLVLECLLRQDVHYRYWYNSKFHGLERTFATKLQYISLDESMKYPYFVGSFKLKIILESSTSSAFFLKRLRFSRCYCRSLHITFSTLSIWVRWVLKSKFSESTSS